MQDVKSVLDENGNEVLWAVAVHMMDDNIRESLHADLAPCEPQIFFDVYMKMHKAKFNECFTV